MNYKQAVAQFREEYLPSIRNQEGNRHDYPLRSQTWNDYVDYLQKSGLITVEQAYTWDQPAFCKSPGDKRRERVSKAQSMLCRAHDNHLKRAINAKQV